MSIQIIKQGRIKKYGHVCRECECEYCYTGKDTEWDEEEEVDYTVCPTCGTHCYTAGDGVYSTGKEMVKDKVAGN